MNDGRISILKLSKSEISDDAERIRYDSLLLIKAVGKLDAFPRIQFLMLMKVNSFLVWKSSYL